MIPHVKVRGTTKSASRPDSHPTCCQEGTSKSMTAVAPVGNLPKSASTGARQQRRGRRPNAGLVADEKDALYLRRRAEDGEEGLGRRMVESGR